MSGAPRMPLKPSIVIRKPTYAARTPSFLGSTRPISTIRASQLFRKDSLLTQPTQPPNYNGQRPLGVESGWKEKIDVWMVNEGHRVIFLFVWTLAHILLFSLQFVQFALSDNAVIARSLLGGTYATARASALVLHVDAGLILFPICRNLLTLLRSTPLNRVIPFDEHIGFHKLTGWSILFWTIVHVIAHYVNFYRIAVSTSPNALAFQSSTPLLTWLNLSFVQGPGWTGHGMLVGLALIVVFSTQRLRSANFERFLGTHHTGLTIFFVLFSIHGAFCLIKNDRNPPCPNAASFYKYWVAGAAIYLVERCVREHRARRPASVSKVVLHPSSVVEIQMKKTPALTRVRAGQYIYLNCPEVSLWQWHPFTLTSAPEEEYFSVHVRVVGDFTREMAFKLGCGLNDEGKKTKKEIKKKEERKERGETVAANEEGVIPVAMLPRIVIDGPYGSASEDVFNYEVSLLVGAGIGVTPFASVLKSIWYRINYPTKPTSLRKVYFFWICRDKEAFEWFQSLLLALEESDPPTSASSRDRLSSHFLEIRTYLTGVGKFRASDLHNLMLNTTDDADALTGLRSPTYYGRPNWDNVFEGISHRHPRTDVGTFYCGPRALEKELRRMCSAWSGKSAKEANEANRNVSNGGTKFFFNKENF